MCGIIGGTATPRLTDSLFRRMTETLRSRGPDGQGFWRGREVILGHRRLSVLDLSEAASQPMQLSEHGPVLSYNGECYNHQKLRKELPQTKWRSSGDTETLLRLYEHLGTAFIQKIQGMFALAIFDQKTRKLHLFRDRLGEKPLYYYHKGPVFFFASDLKPFYLHPEIPVTTDEKAISQYFLHNYIPRRSILQDVRKLTPATHLTYDIDGQTLRESHYWKPSVHSVPMDLTHDEAIAKFKELFESVTQDQMISDVPIGCWLSGGIDSSLVAAAAQKAGNQKLRTFTIAFDEEVFDESSHARAIANHLRTDHTELTARPADCLELLEEITHAYAEPFADASMLPTMLLSKLTRDHVTVALSGDGGDELFLGYDRYRWLRKIALVDRAPVLRRMLAAAGLRLPDYRSQIRSAALAYPRTNLRYSYLFTGWNQHFIAPVLAHTTTAPKLLSRPPEPKRFNEMERAAWDDLHHYLPGDLLVKTDRAAMHSSLETRTPFLDHRIVEFALNLPPELKFVDGKGKQLLRSLLGESIPRTLFERPKTGFAVPLRHWFRGRLQSQLNSKLSAQNLRRIQLSNRPVFNDSAVEHLLLRHQSGRWNFERQLFAIFVFVLWWERYLQ